MFKYAAAEGLWNSARLGKLFELAEARNRRAPDRRAGSSDVVVLRRRHRLRSHRSERRDAPIDVVKKLVAPCVNRRDVLLVAMLATTGLRRGEALGLRLSDIHFLPSSLELGCQIVGPHLHVTPRPNSNGANVKTKKPRVVPVPDGLVLLYDRYRHERDSCRVARECDFVFVNLYRQPLGEPMKLHSANELFARLSRRVGQHVSPHMLRHTFGTGAAREASLDVVAELLGHASLRSTQIYLHPDMALQRRAVEHGALSKHLDGLEPR
jgi:integrase/recombinase XerD